MYKTSVPIAVNSMSDTETEKDLQKYLDYFKLGNIERVYIALLPGTYTNAFDKDISSKKFKRAVEFFKENGLETGVWIGGFGHGSNLAHESEKVFRRDYQKIVGVRGESYEHGYCPSDERFAVDYADAVKKIAMLAPDIIMLDDDFRLNNRRYHFGCFCEKHLAEYRRIICEDIPREQIEERIFTGGKNKYRDAYMEMAKNTLSDFAQKIRNAVDEINPSIRIGLCTSPGVWDFEGGSIELSKILAGSTKPLLRTFAAPYHNQYDIMDVIECTRSEFAEIASLDENIEFFSEGDVYPRPRYNVSAKCLELFDLALQCGEYSDGILKYIFVYDKNIDYETGYIDNHIRTQKSFCEIRSIFADKTPTGIHVYSHRHKAADWVVVKSRFEKASQELPGISTVSEILSKNSISTTYVNSEYPIAVSGENARHIPFDMLKNGALLDATAAKILCERGMDTGLISCEEANGVTGEYFIADKDCITGIDLNPKS